MSFARSAVKPIQALPLVEDGVIEAFAISDAELAVCCASHNAEPRHIELVTGLLRRLELTEDALACGPHEPMHAPAARALRAPDSSPGGCTTTARANMRACWHLRGTIAGLCAVTTRWLIPSSSGCCVRWPAGARLRRRILPLPWMGAVFSRSLCQ